MKSMGEGNVFVSAWLSETTVMLVQMLQLDALKVVERIWGKHAQ